MKLSHIVGRITFWIERRRSLDRIPRWQRLLLRVSRPMRRWFWTNYFDNGIVLCAARRGAAGGKPLEVPETVYPLPATPGRWYRLRGQERRG